MNILVAVGTRPEAIKLVPIILALRESPSYRPIVVSPGQHHRMVAELFELAGITIDAELWAGNPGGRLNELVASVMRRFESFCTASFGDNGAEIATADQLREGHYPAAVLVHGDTSSAMATALASFHLRIPIVHVEAGLRTGGSILTPFPEELNRQLVSCMASFHLAPTSENQQNLVRENIDIERIFVTGNTGIDALRWAASLEVPWTDPRVAAVADSDRRVVVVTAHRRENWNGGLAGIAAGVSRLALDYPDVAWIVPMHPNPLVRDELGTPLEGIENVILTEPMNYAEFARLLARCDLVITDSGGIQEEAPSLDKPVLVVRDSTERNEGAVAGTLRLVGTDPQEIEHAGRGLLDDPEEYRRMAEAINPYGDGHAAARIVAALENLRHGGSAPVPYGPGYDRQAVLAAAGYDAGLHPHAVPAAARGRSGTAPVEEPWRG